MLNLKPLFLRLVAFLKSNPRVLYSFLVGYLIAHVLKRKFLYVDKLPVDNLPVPERVSFYNFLMKIEAKEVSKVILKPEDINFQVGDKLFQTSPATYHPGIVELLYQKRIPFDEVSHFASSQHVSWKSVFFVIFPFLYLGCVVYIFKNYMGPNAGTNSKFFGTKKPKNKKRTLFKDVAGIEKAKNEVKELTDFYENPEKYKSFGARIPTGILLVGPPGTGKTLLAKALASECKMPFFYCSGSDFVEVYSGRGAARVRNLFQKARKKSPSVIFIDEIDAIGKARSIDNAFAQNEEREQTLNQLLFCMDGFDKDSELSKTVIVMAATNRYNSLDKALTRPGRFDRVVQINLPNIVGRIEIFKVHCQKLLVCNVDYNQLSILTDGFSGADIAHICNESAIRAIRRESEVVQMEDFLNAISDHSYSRKPVKHSASSLVNQFF